MLSKNRCPVLEFEKRRVIRTFRIDGWKVASVLRTEQRIHKERIKGDNEEDNDVENLETISVNSGSTLRFVDFFRLVKKRL